MVGLRFMGERNPLGCWLAIGRLEWAAFHPSKMNSSRVCGRGSAVPRWKRSAPLPVLAQYLGWLAPGTGRNRSIALARRVHAPLHYIRREWCSGESAYITGVNLRRNYWLGCRRHPEKWLCSWTSYFYTVFSTCSPFYALFLLLGCSLVCSRWHQRYGTAPVLLVFALLSLLALLTITLSLSLSRLVAELTGETVLLHF